MHKVWLVFVGLLCSLSVSVEGVYAQEAAARDFVNRYCDSLSSWAKNPDGEYQFDSKNFFSGVSTPVYDEYKGREVMNADYFTDFTLMLLEAKQVEVKFSPIRELRLITGELPTIDKSLEKVEYYCAVLDKETRVEPKDAKKSATASYQTRNYIYIHKTKQQIYGILNREGLSDLSDSVMSADLAYLSGAKAYEDKNYKEAFRLFGLAHSKGHAKGGVKYALMLFDGKGTKKDRKRAFALMKDLADKENDAEACYCVGLFYCLGQGVKANKSLAKDYFYRAESEIEWKRRAYMFMTSVRLVDGVFEETITY